MKGQFIIVSLPDFRLASYILTLAMWLAPVCLVAAVDSKWNTSVSNGDWNTAANWADGQIPISAGDVARFPTPPGTTISASLPAEVTLGKLVFENTIHSVAVQGPAALAFDNLGSEASEINFSTSTSTASNTISAPIRIADSDGLAVDIGEGKTLLIGGGIASESGGDLIKRGVGSLHLTGNSGTWSGRLVVDAGLLRVEGAASVGASSGGILVNPDGILLLYRNTDLQSEPIELAGGVLRAEGQSSNQPSMLGPLLVSADSRIEPTGFFEISGNISGPGGVKFSGQTTIIRGDNSYAGITTIGAGRVDVHTATGLGAAAQGTILEPSGTLNLHAATTEPILLRGGTLNFQTATSAAGPLTLQSGLIALSNAADFAAPVTLEQSNADAAISGNGRLFTGGVVGSGDLKLIGNVIVNGAPLAHDGDLIIQHAESLLVRLQTPNTFTGNLVVRSGGVAIEHDAATFRPTIVEGGQLRIDRNDIVFSPEIRFSRGVVSNLGQISSHIILAGTLGTRVLSGGDVSGDISGSADVAFEGRNGNDQTISGQNSFDGIALIGIGVVNANSSTAFGTTNWATVVGGILNVNQPTGEQFYVNGSGVLNVNAPLERAPRFLVSTSSSANETRVVINAPSTFNDEIAVARGHLEVNANLVARSLSVRNRGRVTVASTAAFSVGGGEIDVREGRIEGKFTNAPVLRKTTYFGAELGAMPQFSGDIVIEEGLLEAYPGAFGTTAGVTRVRNDGQLMLRGVGTIADDIFLENAKGPLNRGGLFVGGVCCGQTITDITGRLHLGDEGSILGAGGNGRDGILRFHAPVEGGDLTTWGNGISVQLLSDNLYTGVTDVRQGYVELMGSGRLSRTSAIVLHGNDETSGTLLLDNATLGGGVDRVDASVPVEFRGGNLSAFGGGAEHFGTLRFVEGHAEIDTRTVALSANRIERSPGATVFAELLGSMPVAEVPTNYNGVIPWMQVRPPYVGGPTYELFGEVVNGQVLALNRTTIVTDINAATATSNVGIPGSGRPVLTADRTINSLLVERDGIVDLGGHTLTVTSGGISAWGGTIRNGNLTAGSSRELIVHYGAVVDANIVDGPDGPTDVTIYGSSISGNNSFTGRLRVNQDGLSVQNEDSLPDGVDLDILGGSMQIGYAATRVKELRRVRVASGGELTQLFTGHSGAGEFSFEEMILENGGIFVQRLTGNGPIRKTTIGSASINVANRTDATYTGQIDVDEGELDVVGLPGAKFAVNGGRLRLIDGANSIRLNGGGFEFYRHSGPVEVSATSTMMPTPQFNLPNPALTGPLTGSGKLTFNSKIQYLNFDIDARARLSIARDNPDFSGDVDIRLAEISVGRPLALGTGAITVFADGRLTLGGSSSNPFAVANRITLEGGQLRGGSQSRHTGELHVVSPSYVGGLELAGALYFTNGVPLTTIGSETTRFRGQMHVGADAQLVLGRYEGSNRGLVEVGGSIVADEPASKIDFRRGGLDELQFAASLHVPASRTLEVRLDGQTMPLSLGPGQTISGGGSILNSINVGLGSIVSPGDPGTETGELSVVGDVTFEAGARVQLGIGGLDSSKYDKMDVTGKVSLGGVLDVQILNLGEGFYLPAVGNSFAILNSTESFSGMFTNSEMLISVAGGSVISWALELESHRLVLRAHSITPTIDGDFSGDGIVDSADYAVWRDTLGGKNLAADGNRDGKIDALDYAIWKSHFGEAEIGRGSVDVHATVPEPSTILPFALILIYWPRMRLRRTSFPTRGKTFNALWT